MSNCMKKEDAIKYLKEIQRLYVSEDKRIKQVIDMLSTDVVEVVRCKDCKHAVINKNILEMPLICGLTKMFGQTDPEWFCADGERKNR